MWTDGFILPKLAPFLHVSGKSMAVIKRSARSRNQNVLLAEDETAIRELISSYLTNLGFTVHQSANGQESLEKAQEFGPRKFSLLITDMVMPEMGGVELAAALRQENHDLRVLFISGYTDDVVLLDEREKSRSSFLKKPFNFDALRNRVEALLDAD